MRQSECAVEHSGLVEAVENAADGIVVTDTSGKIQYVNPAFTALTGYCKEEAVGQNPRLLKSGRHAVPFYEDLWSTILSGGVWHGDVTNRRKDGTFYDEEMRIAQVKDSNGATTGYIAIKHDVTERRAHQQTERLLAAIVESSDDAIIATTPAGIIIAWNRGAENMFGYSGSDATGRHVSMLMAPERLDELKHFTSQILEGFNVSQYESVCLRRDGSRLNVAVTGTPLKTSTGEVVTMSAILRDITPRQEAERKLRESEGRFREVFECAPFGIYVAGPDERFLRVNEAYCRMVGYSEKELLTRTWVELCVTEDQPAALLSKGQMWKDGTSGTETERRYVNKDGSIVWCKVKISSLRAADGGPLCSVIHVEDITERRRTEIALRESEERFRIMADGCATPMWVTDAAAGIQFTNRTFREFCGNTHDQVDGRKWQLLIHPDDLPGFLRETTRAVQTHTIFKAEARIRRADGEWRWLMAQTEPRFSTNGEFLGHVGIAVDITERRRAEEAVHSSERRLLGITDSANDAILMMDPGGAITYWNPAAESMFGYAAEEAIGQDLHILLTSEQDRAAHLSAFPEFLRNGRGNAVGRRVELKTRRKSGREIVVELSLSAISLNDEWHAIGIVRDVTERKRTEQTLKNSEEKFRQLTENIREVFWMMNAEGTEMLYIGPAYERIWGRSCKSLYECPMGWMEAILLDDRNRAHETFMRQLQGESIDSEYRISTPDGKQRWIRDRAFPIRDQGGELIRIGGIAEDITERKAAEERIQFLAYHDALTELPHRLLLQDRMENALAGARRNGTKVALMFLDLDQFKAINDSFGHSFADILLKDVAKRIKDCLREQDTAARVGGDEFLILLSSARDAADAAIAAERIATTLSDNFDIQGQSLKVTCSVGISMFPEHGADSETLIRNADAAMYSAKSDGRNKVRFFTDRMNAEAVERLAIDKNLRLALDKDEFFLVYQPQIQIESGTITGFEALIRWQQPEMGLIPPDRFISIAEDNGLIVQIGEWVLRTACAQAKQWQNDGLAAVPVAVNVSAVQFRQEGFTALVGRVLVETGLSAQYLELEVTESLLLSNADVVFATLQELKKMGLQLAIDDFGTGYSSLSYLKKFPVDKLKIDRSFIRDIAVDSDYAAITNAIISMGKSLHLKVIAEGVETEAQFSVLREYECDEIQGYYFSKPVSADEAACIQFDQDHRTRRGGLESETLRHLLCGTQIADGGYRSSKQILLPTRN